jgi:hypothetical protein
MRSIRPVRLAAGFALLVSAQPVVASESANATQAGGIGERTGSLLQPQPKVRGNPYSRLFEVPDLRTTTPVRRLSAPLLETSQPRVVCGMTLIPIDPNVDPKIYVEPRRSDTRYSIRAIPPPVCK